MARISIDFDYTLNMIELANHIKGQFRLRDFEEDMSVKTMLAYAALCDSYIEDAEEISVVDYINVVDYICEYGTSSKKSYAMLLAASFCHLPNEINRVLWDTFGIEQTYGE